MLRQQEVILIGINMHPLLVLRFTALIEKHYQLFLPNSEHGFDVTSFGRDCTIIGMEPLTSKDLCIKAATEMGKRYHKDDSRDDVPKGCYANKIGDVYWNTHSIGKWSITHQAICRCKYSRYSLRYGMKLN